MQERADEQYNDEEAARRRDAVIKHMLNKPPRRAKQIKRRRPKAVAFLGHFFLE
jgi:hypothetical protein